MRALTSSFTEWVAIDGDQADEQATDELDARLRQLIEAERLIVLAGLGTSLAIAALDGSRPAPSMADLWEKAKANAGVEAWSNALQAAGWDDGFGEDIELLLTRCQMALSLRPSDELATFVSECERVIVAACRFVGQDTALPVHEAFLRRIARRPARLPRT